MCFKTAGPSLVRVLVVFALAAGPWPLAPLFAEDNPRIPDALLMAAVTTQLQARAAEDRAAAALAAVARFCTALKLRAQAAPDGVVIGSRCVADPEWQGKAMPPPNTTTPPPAPAH